MLYKIRAFDGARPSLSSVKKEKNNERHDIMTKINSSNRKLEIVTVDLRQSYALLVQKISNSSSCTINFL